jgi:hypothetical protein
MFLNFSLNRYIEMSYRTKKLLTKQKRQTCLPIIIAANLFCPLPATNKLVGWELDPILFVLPQQTHSP